MALPDLKTSKPLLPEKITFEQIVKHPVVYALVIITSLLWIFIFLVVRSNEDNIKSREGELGRLRQDNIELRAALKISEQSKENIYRALLAQLGTNLEISNKLDSIHIQKQTK